MTDRWRPRRSVIARLGVAGLLCVPLLAACGGDSDSADAANRPAANGSDQAVADLASEEELQPGLLTIDDMPTGWAEIPDDGEEDDPLCGIRLTGLLGLDVEHLPSARVEFADDPDTGPLITEQLGFVPAGRGEEALSLMDEALTDCEDQIDDTKVSASPLSFPALGDGSLAYRLHLQGPDGQAADMDLVYVRVGDLMIVMSGLDIFGDPTELLSDYVPLAVERASAELLGQTADGGDPIESMPELAVGESATFDNADVELFDIRYGAGEELPRMVYLTLKVTAASQPVDPAYVQGHFVSDAGRVYDHTGYICNRNDLPTGDELQPGQYVQGCEAYDIPNSAGRLVFGEPGDGFYIPIEAKH